MSFKLVDKIKKSIMPGPLKKVFEAYVSFGNADGTSIRPTANAVAKRASCSRPTVARRTPELVKWGFLIHELNEDGTYKTHAYTKEGVWAYVYRASLAPMENPQVIATFEFERQQLAEKRRNAGAQGGRPKRQMGLFDESNLLQPPLKQFATNPLLQFDANAPKQIASQTIPSSPLRSEEQETTSKADPSAVGTAVREVSKRASEVEILQPHTEEKKHLYSLSDWINGLPGTEEDGEEKVRFYFSERHQREFSIEEASLAGGYLLELFPRSTLDETETVLMAEIALDFLARYPNPFQPDEDEYYANSVAECYTVSTMRDYLDWNRKHKKGGMVHANVAEFHKAWFSDNDRCARIQWEDHNHAECPVCKLKAKSRHAAVNAELHTGKDAPKGIDIADLDGGKVKAVAAGGFDPEEA